MQCHRHYNKNHNERLAHFLKLKKETIMTQHVEIYKEMLNQLGGKALEIMAGAKDFSSDDSVPGTYTLKFKIGENSKGISHVFVSYNSAKDLYDMRFEKISINRKTFDVKRTVKHEEQDLYGDMLRITFEEATDLTLAIPIISRK